MKSIILLLYYLIGKHLPISYRYGILGKLSKKVRFFLCKNIFRKCGNYVNIEHGVDFGNGKKIFIGDYSGLGVNCKIPSSIKIGNHVMMGPEVIILGQNHEFSNCSIPMMFQGNMEISPVTIDDDVWIGTRSIILPGVHIGEGSIIGAGSVVTKKIPPYSVFAGNPAKFISSRIKIQCQ